MPIFVCPLSTCSWILDFNLANKITGNPYTQYGFRLQSFYERFRARLCDGMKSQWRVAVTTKSNIENRCKGIYLMRSAENNNKWLSGESFCKPIVDCSEQEKMRSSWSLVVKQNNVCIIFDVQVKKRSIYSSLWNRQMTRDEYRKKLNCIWLWLDALLKSQAVRIKRDRCFKHSSFGWKVFNNTFQVHGDRDWSSRLRRPTALQHVGGEWNWIFDCWHISIRRILKIRLMRML